MNAQRRLNNEQHIMTESKGKQGIKPTLLKGNKGNKRRIVIWVLFVFISLFGIISRYSYITQMNYDVADLSQQLIAQEAVNSSLQLQLDQFMNLPQIRYTAMTQLGMQQPDHYQTIYIQVPRYDEISLASKPLTFYDKILVSIDDLKVSLMNIRNIFG
ncbi:MAG: cell division protein FtsL [Clostridiales bacterium]|nr:cell division protein FtsL [Clostridiales bacterium]